MFVHRKLFRALNLNLSCLTYSQKGGLRQFLLKYLQSKGTILASFCQSISKGRNHTRQYLKRKETHSPVSVNLQRNLVDLSSVQIRGYSELYLELLKLAARWVLIRITNKLCVHREDIFSLDSSHDVYCCLQGSESASDVLCHLHGSGSTV